MNSNVEFIFISIHFWFFFLLLVKGVFFSFSEQIVCYVVRRCGFLVLD